MKISIASDHAGFEQKQALVGYLASKGHDVIDRGPDCDDRVDYPDYAARIPSILLAATAMPMPVPHTSTPRSAMPSTTSCATRAA